MKSAFELLLVCVGLLVSQSLGVAQSPASRQNPPNAVPKDIHQLFVDDQAERTVRDAIFKYGSDANSRDALRRAETKLLLAAGELKTARDFHDAAFIFQHGHSPDDYLLAHILAIDAVVRGDASSKWIAAATLDRYLQAIGQRQVFGTQNLNKSYLYLLQHKDDPNAVNSAGAQQKGMTQGPYDRTLLPDALRRDFCVRDQAAQVTSLSEINAGQPITGRLPPGCNN